MNLDQAFEHYLPIIETELRRFFEEIPVALQPFYGMMRYHMGWVDETFSPVTPRLGKRLRPLLCLLTCGAAGGETTDALPAAVALELVHNFSLVHDDIQDNSPVRRHKKTVWTIWGQPQAINVGDGPPCVTVAPLVDKIYTGNYLDKTVSVIDATTRSVNAVNPIP